jgi:hypothetical protein
MISALRRFRAEQQFDYGAVLRPAAVVTYFATADPSADCQSALFLLGVRH